MTILGSTNNLLLCLEGEDLGSKESCRQGEEREAQGRSLGL